MKKLLWALILIGLVLYSLLIYNWIQEGNQNFDQQRQEQQQ